ncbi:MAG TPA: PilZ domain-containing protein [Anaerolineales bacterium]|nr:PilZ domain-containing protein [Anaerolineales bacterium]
MSMERRRLDRRNFSYYMRVMNEANGELVGHLSDLSTGGFKLDTRNAILVNQDYHLRMELSDEIANKKFMVFIARSKWCQRDHYDSSSYNVGFQIVNMAPGDAEIFTRMFEKYGSQNRNSASDYLWK